MEKSSYALVQGKGYNLMNLYGTYDYWDFIQYPGIILDYSIKTSTYKIIVNVIPVQYTEVSTLELFLLGEGLAEVLRDRVKMALVWNINQQDGLLERVAVNRAACMQVFPSLEEARLWLLLDQEQEPVDLFRNKGRI